MLALNNNDELENNEESGVKIVAEFFLKKPIVSEREFI